MYICTIHRNILFNAKYISTATARTQDLQLGRQSETRCCFLEVTTVTSAKHGYLGNPFKWSWDVMGCHGMSWDIYLQMLQM